MTLHEKLNKLLAKHDLDDVIPALANFLAIAGVESRVSKRVFVAYVVEVIDRAYEEREQGSNEKQ